MADDKAQKPAKKAIMVPLHGHEWPVYVCKMRDGVTFRVPHRVGGIRHLKSFADLAKAKKFAKSLLYQAYGGTRTEINLTEDERRDCAAAYKLLRDAGIRSSLESVARHYADLAALVGGRALLTDVARKYAASQGQTCSPIDLSVLRDKYVAAMKNDGRSDRYVQALKSFTSIFVTRVGETVKTDEVTREDIQKFLDERKVGARGKVNFAEAIRTMFAFAKARRYVPEDWREIDHVTLPTVRQGKVHTYTPEDLKKLLAACPDEFLPCLAIAAFTGMRSNEIERLSWTGIRLKAKQPQDQIINLDAAITKTNSRRPVPIHDTLWKWLAPITKPHGHVWKGTHHRFYRLQQQIAKKAGVVWMQNALRHTCISARVALTRDVPKIAYESGNSVDQIKRHYLDLLAPSVAEEWFGITPAVVDAYKKKAAEKPAPNADQHSKAEEPHG